MSYNVVDQLQFSTKRTALGKFHSTQSGDLLAGEKPHHIAADYFQYPSRRTALGKEFYELETSYPGEHLCYNFVDQLQSSTKRMALGRVSYNSVW